MSVKTLAKRFEKQTKEREEAEARQKKLRERDELIDNAPQWQVTDFYCWHCDIQFSANGYKVIHHLPGERIAFYEAKCPGCWHRERRRITDKVWDKFFLNPILQKQRKEQAADMLQPGQEGFIARYGDPFKKQYAEMEKAEKAKWTKKTYSL
jgi:hypothetical protein